MEEKTCEFQDEVAMVKQMIDRGDFKELHEMIQYWKALKSFGVFAGMVRRIAIGTAAFLVALAAISDSVREGVKRWLGL